MLSNSYVAVRHGESVANVQGIVSSNPEYSTVIHGLTAKGQDQARQAGGQIAGLPRPLVIVTSDFTRARETAAAIAAALPLPSVDIITDMRLRERFFGDHDGQGTPLFVRV